MSKIRQRFSIRSIITTAIALITIIFMLFTGTMLFSVFTEAVFENAYISTKEIIHQVNLNLGFYISDILYVASYIKDLTREGGNIPRELLMNNMVNILDSRPDMLSILLFDLDGNAIVNSSEIETKDPLTIIQQQWFKETLLAEGNFTFSSPHVQNIYHGQYPWVITYSQEIRFDLGDGLKRGILMIDMNFSTISNICRQASLGLSGYIFLIDSKGEIVFHPRQQLINSGLLTEDIETIQENVFGTYTDAYKDRERLTIINTVNHSRWRIVGIAFVDEIVARRKDFTIIYVLTAIFGVIAALLIARIISKRISSPIKKLETLMRKVENGNFDVTTRIEGSREIANLSHTFNIMVTRIKQLNVEIIEEQEQKRLLEFEALNAKINPHFLYNTLDSIVWLAEEKDSVGVINMITALARLFRISISKGREIITIKEELEHVESYLFIQKIRYKDKFEYLINLPDNLKHYPTIKLILQPIVENAIYHGIKYLQEPGLIEIRVYEEDDKIIFLIKDNGVGMDAATLNKVMAKTFQREKETGIGVHNIHDRITLAYGFSYGITIMSEIDEGTNVYISIPKGKEIEPIKGKVNK